MDKTLLLMRLLALDHFDVFLHAFVKQPLMGLKILRQTVILGFYGGHNVSEHCVGAVAGKPEQLGTVVYNCLYNIVYLIGIDFCCGFNNVFYYVYSNKNLLIKFFSLSERFP